jgi:hypothetical protein
VNDARTTRLISCALARSWPLRADLGEQVRARGQEENLHICAALVEPLLQAGVVLGLRQVHAPVVQQLREARELVVARPLGRIDLAELVLDEGAVLIVAALVTRHGEDAAVGRQLAVAPGLEQRRHQFAPRQVAGAAEENEVEAHADVI